MDENGSHEVFISEQTWFYGVCVCGWRGQGWDTRLGAENEADFHLQHPALTTGEHPAIEEQQ